MIKPSVLFVVFLLPLFALAQEQNGKAIVPINTPTLAAVLANRPEHIPQEQWLSMMEQPVNRTLYPLRVTQTMLDTLDARQLDLRFQYVMVREPIPVSAPSTPVHQ